MNFTKKLALIPLALASFVGLVSCGGKTTSSTTPTVSTPVVSTPVVSTPVTSTPTTPVVSTPGVTTTPVISTDFDKDAGYRNITETLKLTKTVGEKNFLDDGIGYASLIRATDGDTATFRMKTPSKDGTYSVTIRFHGIDTPESTGEVQKWGKAASVYNASRINNAYDFVLEATSIPATPTGNRWLGYVWYRESETAEYKNLNLEMVENGYTTNRLIAGNDYYTYFDEAEQFAKTHQMHVHSTDVDKYYTDNPIEATVASIEYDWTLKTGYQYWNEELDCGSKVTFNGFVLEHTTTSSGTNYYTVADYDENGVLHKVKLYSGYSSDPFNSSIKVGSYCHFVGTISKFGGSWQVAVGGTYVALMSGPKYTYTITKDYYVTFDSSNALYSSKTETAMRGDLFVKSVSLEGTTLTIVGSANTYEAATAPTDVTLKVEISSNYDYSSLSGSYIRTKGLFIEKGVYKIFSTSDIKII